MLDAMLNFKLLTHGDDKEAQAIAGSSDLRRLISKVFRNFGDGHSSAFDESVDQLYEILRRRLEETPTPRRRFRYNVYLERLSLECLQEYHSCARCPARAGLQAPV